MYHDMNTLENTIDKIIHNLTTSLPFKAFSLLERPMIQDFSRQRPQNFKLMKI